MIAIVYRVLILYPLLIFSVTMHEYFHGLVAEKFGDDTARYSGRLTLNPLAHIDFFGTFLLPMLAIITGAPVFGWAKPVPVDPYRLNNPRKDMIFIGLAGPAINLLIAVASAAIVRIIINIETFYFVIPFFQYMIILNVILGVFNMVPIPPLDGSRVLSGLLPPHLAFQYEKITPYGFFIVLFLLMSGILGTVMGPVLNFIVSMLLDISKLRSIL
ncbi:MAG: site-2 protease family protein [Elusimicrobia bacterium]|nr:site-2 protease family protein [Elusimicrobiota bacterium]